MKMSELFPSRFLRAADISPGREVSATIEAVEMVSIESEDEMKPCLYFRGTKKGLC